MRFFARTIVYSGIPLLAGIACATQEAAPPTPVPDPAAAAQAAELRAAAAVSRIEVEPQVLVLTVGETAPIRVAAYDSSGRAVVGAPLRVSGADGLVRADLEFVRALHPGTGTLLVRVATPDGAGDRSIAAELRVRVEDRPVQRIELEGPGDFVYAGTVVRFRARPLTRIGLPRANTPVRWNSTAPAVVDVGPGGIARAGVPGMAMITAAAQGVSTITMVDVRPNPARSLRLEGERIEARTGEVVRLRATARDERGRFVPRALPLFSVAPDPSAAEPGALVFPDGTFVAEDPGIYTVVASFGNLVDEVVIAVEPRRGSRELVVLDHATHAWTAMTDLWVFEGVDGRSYAYTGTRQPGGRMYVWHVTDPRAIVLTDSVVVDARAVSEVKVSEDGRFAVLTREGASDGRNGIVLLDLADPAHPRVASSYIGGLGSGVHDVWIEGSLIYAATAGTQDLHIVDATDIYHPRVTGRWSPGPDASRLQDVAVKNGLAYLSYGEDGLVILDAGVGLERGTPASPRFISRLRYRGGRTHTAFRYENYLFVGDEILDSPEAPGAARGYVHVFDLADIENPVEVATYRVPEAGAQNLWVEDDILYVAYEQGGLRVVDVSGELRGDLYEQGREIAVLSTATSAEDGAWFANRSRAWGIQPHKGAIFASDKHSGLWAVRLVAPERAENMQ